MIVRLVTGLNSNRFLVGWKTISDGGLPPGLIAGDGMVLMPLENLPLSKQSED